MHLEGTGSRRSQPVYTQETCRVTIAVIFALAEVFPYLIKPVQRNRNDSC